MTQQQKTCLASVRTQVFSSTIQMNLIKALQLCCLKHYDITTACDLQHHSQVCVKKKTTTVCVPMSTTTRIGVSTTSITIKFVCNCQSWHNYKWKRMIMGCWGNLSNGTQRSHRPLPEFLTNLTGQLNLVILRPNSPLYFIGA